MTPLGNRLLPALTPENRDFWTGGAVGELRIHRCQTCGRWIHPPNPMCGGCLGRDVRPEATSGLGTVFSHTLNHHPWRPDVPVPYVIALVEIEDQAEVRLNTNIVDCNPADVRVGLPVEVCFEQHGEIYIPLFRPRSS